MTTSAVWLPSTTCRRRCARRRAVRAAFAYAARLAATNWSRRIPSRSSGRRGRRAGRSRARPTRARTRSRRRPGPARLARDRDPHEAEQRDDDADRDDERHVRPDRLRSRARDRVRSVSPPASCVVSATRTLRQRMSRSGWWSACSARNPIRTTNAIASANDAQLERLHDLVALARPARRARRARRRSRRRRGAASPPFNPSGPDAAHSGRARFPDIPEARPDRGRARPRASASRSLARRTPTRSASRSSGATARARSAGGCASRASRRGRPRARRSRCAPSRRRARRRVGPPIHWSDGHETGIYAWSILHAWARRRRPELAHRRRRPETQFGVRRCRAGSTGSGGARARARSRRAGAGRSSSPGRGRSRARAAPELVGRLDAFGGHREAERVAELHDRGDDRRVSGSLPRPR